MVLAFFLLDGHYYGTEGQIYTAKDTPKPNTFKHNRRSWMTLTRPRSQVKSSLFSFWMRHCLDIPRPS